jgi:hypothetical protein
LVALDLLPRPCREEELTACPLLDNARIPEVKALLRTRIARLAPAAGRYNSLHSSDNSAAAWQMVRMLLPGDEMRLRALVGARRADFATEEEVIADLTRYGNRAKVEVIRHAGGLAVKKTFRPHALRFLWRELDLYDRFAAEREELLPVLARGPNHFLLPYVEDRFGQASQRVGGRRPPPQLSLRAAQHMLSFLRHLLDRGYEPIDVTPANNVLIDAEGRLRIIDLEFVQRRGDAPIPADRSWSLHGAPDDFAGDLPAAGFYLGDPYPTEWFPFVGLSRASLLHDPTWLQHAKCMAHRPMILLHWAMGMARRAGPALARRARRLRAQTRRRG